MNDELSIIQKSFDMLLWLLPKIDKFPRKQKYLLGERIERTALDFMGQLQRAKFSNPRKAALLETHVCFEQYKTLVRLALGLGYWNRISYTWRIISVLQRRLMRLAPVRLALVDSIITRPRLWRYKSWLWKCT